MWCCTRGAELAAAPIATARGIPLVTVAFSGVLPEPARDEVLDALQPMWQAEGLGDPTWADLYGQLYLHPFPSSFGQRPDSPVVRPVRPDRGSQSVAPAGWVTPLGADRPFVYVTSGTELPSVTFPWRELLAALGGLDVDVVATIGPHVDPAAIGAVPANVRIERFVPQTISSYEPGAVVSHGGTECARCGVARPTATRCAPVRRPVGERCRRRRRRLRARRRPGSPKRRGSRPLVAHDPHQPDTPRRTTKRVADEIAAMPPATAVALHVEALVAS